MSDSNPVPKLAILPAAELAAVLHHHFGQCDQHEDMTRPMPPIVLVDFDKEQFTCRVCQSADSFDIPSRHALNLEEYVCRFLRQGPRFAEKHAMSCMCEGSPQ